MRANKSYQSRSLQQGNRRNIFEGELGAISLENSHRAILSVHIFSYTRDPPRKTSLNIELASSVALKRQLEPLRMDSVLISR